MALTLGVNVIETDGKAAPSIQPAATSVGAFVIRAERGVPNVVRRLSSHLRSLAVGIENGTVSTHDALSSLPVGFRFIQRRLVIGLEVFVGEQRFRSEVEAGALGRAFLARARAGWLLFRRSDPWLKATS